MLYYIGGKGKVDFPVEDEDEEPEDPKIVSLLPQWLIDWEKEQGYKGAKD